MKNSFARRVVALVTVALIYSLGADANPPFAGQNAAKVEQLLKQAGINFKHVDGNVWVAKTRGKALPEFDMLIAENQNVLVVGVVMLNKKNLRLSQDLLLKLLKFNHTKDYVKVGFDNDDDLFIRVELNLKSLAAEEFKTTFDTVVALADEVYTEIKPYIVTQ